MLSEARQTICEEALSWLGTPWHHMQRCKGAGVDCIQMIGAIGLTCGYLTLEQLKSVPYYSAQWHLHKNQEKLLDTLRLFGFTEVSLEAKQPGDIVVFQYGKAIAHSGIFLGGKDIIHAPMSSPKKVVRGKLELDLGSRLRKVFVYPGLNVV
jgi:cell wall-associated NlpC family hydrolase